MLFYKESLLRGASILRALNIILTLGFETPTPLMLTSFCSNKNSTIQNTKMEICQNACAHAYVFR